MNIKKGEAFRRKIQHPVKFKLFMLMKLPMGVLSGLRLQSMDAERATVSVPFTYLTKNPFRSTYFACQLMAGEMSTGVLAMQYVVAAESPVSMLVTDVKASFKKKATEKIYFICEEGDKIKRSIEEAISTGEGVAIEVKTVATTASGELITEMIVTWSFKKKK